MSITLKSSSLRSNEMLFFDMYLLVFESIKPIRLLDYNQRTGNKYIMEDCHNYDISKKIFLFYAHQIGFPEYEKIARNCNGSGEINQDYWEKVKSYL
jgi:hypothetical protein